MPSIVILLDNGADLTARNKEGLTAFHVAAESNNKQVMDILRSYGNNTSLENCKAQVPGNGLLIKEQKRVEGLSLQGVRFIEKSEVLGWFVGIPSR